MLGDKVIVAGGRDYTGYDKYLILHNHVSEFIKDLNDVTIVSGGAKGADKQGEIYASEEGLSVDIFKADWDKHGKGAGHRRNIEMAKYSTHLIAFWDGKSKGTAHMIKTAQQMKLTVLVVKY